MPIFRWIWNAISSYKGSPSRFEERRNAVLAISIDAARAEALRQLSDPTRFQVKLAGSRSVQQSSALGPRVREFFGRFERASAIYGDMVLAHELIGPSELYPGVTRIGRDVEHAEVVVDPSNDMIYLVDGSEGEDWKDDWYPSVYHYIVANADDIYGVEL
jgi:hypothetical protein